MHKIKDLIENWRKSREERRRKANMSHEEMINYLQDILDKKRQELEQK